MNRRELLAGALALAAVVVARPACAQRAKTVAELIVVLQSYPQDLPVAVGVGAYKAASVGADLQTMTRDGRRGWFDRHIGPGAETVLVLHETNGQDADESDECRVTLERIEAPIRPPRYWVRATYHGACIDPSGRQYPYWPAPRWSLDGNASVGAQQWGGDHYVAYIWPEVPGTYTIRATAPVGASGEIEVTIP